MTAISVLSPTGESGKTINLPEEIFAAKVNVPLIHQVVVAQQAAARQGTASVKTRGEVRGGGKKPYRQKGTGRARQGSLRAPHYTGGGVVHGPVPRSYAQRTPKKMKVAALRGALSERARNDRVHVVASFAPDEQPKTKDAVAMIASVTGTRRGAGALVVLHREDEAGWKSLRNAPGIHVLHSDQLNTYDVLASDHVVFTEQALSAFLGGPAATVKAADLNEDGEGQL
jgi:large subunit ribosomal protein L4